MDSNFMKADRGLALFFRPFLLDPITPAIETVSIGTENELTQLYDMISSLQEENSRQGSILAEIQAVLQRKKVSGVRSTGTAAGRWRPEGSSTPARKPPSMLAFTPACSTGPQVRIRTTSLSGNIGENEILKSY